MSVHTHNAFTPHEYAYLDRSVLQASHNFNVPSGHQHFVLKSQPQASIQLRNEMLQKGKHDLIIMYEYCYFSYSYITKGSVAS